MKAGLVLLGGIIAAGKSSLANELVAHHGFLRVSTRSALEERARSKGLEPTRSVLQKMGDELDAETGGLWVLDQIEFASGMTPDASRLLLDSVRRDFQIKQARSRWPNRTLYVHLALPLDIARARYDRRKAEQTSDTLVPFDVAKQSPTERHAETLGYLADLVLDTNAIAVDAAANRVSDRLELLLRESTQ